MTESEAKHKVLVILARFRAERYLAVCRCAIDAIRKPENEALNQTARLAIAGMDSVGKELDQLADLISEHWTTELPVDSESLAPFLAEAAQALLAIQITE